MKIYTIAIDPETDYPDINARIRTHDVEFQTKEYFSLKNGRKIMRSSEFTRIFLDIEDAENFIIASLRGMKEHCRSQMRRINQALRDASCPESTKTKSLIKVIYPDGTSTLCTYDRAADIAGMSYGGVFCALSRKNTTRRGFRFERIEK